MKNVKRSEELSKQYCDVTFCEEKDCELISKQENLYSHFIRKTGIDESIQFSVRIWDPDKENTAIVKILLSVLSVPATSEYFAKWGSAVELRISNSGSYLFKTINYSLIRR